MVAVRELHAPETPPPGMEWVSGGFSPFCKGCETGDPFLDSYWPCATLETVAVVLSRL